MRDLIWSRGLSSCSLDELAREAGINRPSLAAGFGDRERIYVAAAGMFLEDMERLAAPALDERSLAAALTRFLGAAIDVYAADGGQGCFVASTAPAEASSEAIRTVLRDGTRTLEEALLARLRRAEEEGELGGADPDAVAAILASLLHGLAIRARAGEGAEPLKEIARAAVRGLLR